MKNIKRWPWDLIAICFTAMLCAAFIVACVKVSDAFQKRDRNFTREQVANAQASTRAKAAQEAHDTAKVRVVACEQYNIQAQTTIVGNVRANLAELQGFARSGVIHRPTTPAQQAVAFKAIVAYAQEQTAAHPPRDCTPSGLDAYYHQPAGTTAAALKGA